MPPAVPLTGIPVSDGGTGALLGCDRGSTASRILSASETNDPTKSDMTTICQPRKAPLIIKRSASPMPRASRPKPVSKSHLVARTTSEPTSAPTTAVNSPSLPRARRRELECRTPEWPRLHADRNLALEILENPRHARLGSRWRTEGDAATATA